MVLLILLLFIVETLQNGGIVNDHEGGGRLMNVLLVAGSVGGDAKEFLDHS